MSIQIGYFRKDEQGQTGVHKDLVGVVCGGGCIRTEDPVGNIEARQGPVMGAVLEYIPSGHGGIAEAVDKDSFIFTFQEVNSQESADCELEIGRVWKRLVEVVVQERSERE